MELDFYQYKEILKIVTSHKGTVKSVLKNRATLASLCKLSGGLL
jgi:hypothetical protein